MNLWLWVVQTGDNKAWWLWLFSIDIYPGHMLPLLPPCQYCFSSLCVFTTAVSATLTTLSLNMLILGLLYNNNSNCPLQQNPSPLPTDALFYLHWRILFLFTAIWLQNALQHDTTTNNLFGIIGETQLDQIKIIHLYNRNIRMTFCHSNLIT